MGWTENYCRNCGKAIPSGLLKCLSCSLNLVSKGNKAAWRCKVCGARIDAMDEVCEICGTNFGSDEEASKDEGLKADAEAGPGFEEEYVCMICNHPVPRKANRCDFCGTVFQNQDGTARGRVVEKIDKADRVEEKRPGRKPRPIPG